MLSKHSQIPVHRGAEKSKLPGNLVLDQKLPAGTQNLNFSDVEAVAVKKDHFHENKIILRLSA